MTRGETLLVVTLCWFGSAPAAAIAQESSGLCVGVSSVALEADDSMVIAGGIGPHRVTGQEGELRATAVVLRDPASATVALVSCDVLILTRDLLDPVCDQVQQKCAIPTENILIHATHTHHAPSTVKVHGYDRDETFCQHVQQAIVQAIVDAYAELKPATFAYQLGQEDTVGRNSRLLLSDNTIYWVGSHDDAVRPTGPFDPDLPVFVFRDPAGSLLAVLFGHSTHTIGSVTGNYRSPAFYGMAAQRMEQELGGKFSFLQGASGSTHRLSGEASDASQKIEAAVRQAIDEAAPQSNTTLKALKRPFTFRVRTFDEQAEDAAVSSYCQKRIGAGADGVIGVFRTMRSVLAARQGEERTTWLQVLRVGDVAIVGVPAELFTVLGTEIKRRSPFKNTVIAELSNDWIGYLPDRDAHTMGGYQVWTGFHSYAEPGTGERVVDAAVDMLRELAADSRSADFSPRQRQP